MFVCCISDKVVAITVLVGIVIGMHVLMYLYNRESYTFLKEIGLVLKLLAVGFSIFVTTMTPWHVLKQNPAFNITGELNVNPVLDRNNSLNVNPGAPAILNVTGQLDVNPVLKVNGTVDDVQLVLKVKGDFNQVLKVNGELNVNHENAILDVDGELNVTGELTVNGVLNVNPVLEVNGRLDVTKTRVFETHNFEMLNVKIGMLNVNGILTVSRVYT